MNKKEKNGLFSQIHKKINIPNKATKFLSFFLWFRAVNLNSVSGSTYSPGGGGGGGVGLLGAESSVLTGSTR